MAEERGLAVVTGASSGIGYELAKCCAADGYDLVIAADEKAIVQAAEDFRSYGVKVDALEADLATEEGVGMLYDAIAGRPVDLLLANAGRGLGHAFLDQDFDDIRQVIGTNITGTVLLIHRVGQDMRARNRGRILLTGSIAGFMPGSFQAVYNATKAYVDSFAYALRNELEGSGITVTVLMPGPTDTDFFEEADLENTRVGRGKKDDPADVAKAGFEAMLRGDGHEVSGFPNKLQALMSRFLSDKQLAGMHRKLAEPLDDGKRH